MRPRGHRARPAQAPALALSLIVPVAAACKSPPKDSAVADAERTAALLPSRAWRPDAPERGPWPAPDGGAEGCAEAAWRIEGDFFEVNTDLCAWTLFSQETTAPIARGDTLRLVLWTDLLWAPSPTLATLGLALEGTVVWERVMEVPGEGFLGEIELIAPEAQPAGATAALLVANHGLNSYRIGDVELEAR